MNWFWQWSDTYLHRQCCPNELWVATEGHPYKSFHPAKFPGGFVGVALRGHPTLMPLFLEFGVTAINSQSSLRSLRISVISALNILTTTVNAETTEIRRDHREDSDS